MDGHSARYWDAGLKSKDLSADLPADDVGLVLFRALAPRSSCRSFSGCGECRDRCELPSRGVVAGDHMVAQFPRCPCQDRGAVERLEPLEVLVDLSGLFLSVREYRGVQRDVDLLPHEEQVESGGLDTGPEAQYVVFTLHSSVHTSGDVRYPCMPVRKPDPATWLSSADVARELSVKPRTVVDMVQKGKLHPSKYVRPGAAGGAISLFDPAEVQGLADERRAAKTEIVPVNGPGPKIGDAVQLRMPNRFAQPAPELPFWQKRYLTLEESVAYTGLSGEYIKRNLSAFPGPHNRKVYRRESLDQL